MGNSNLLKNRSETSYLLNKLNVLFEMPVYDTIAGFSTRDEKFAVSFLTTAVNSMACDSDEYKHGLTITKTHRHHPSCSVARSTVYPWLPVAYHMECSFNRPL